MISGTIYIPISVSVLILSTYLEKPITLKSLIMWFGWNISHLQAVFQLLTQLVSNIDNYAIREEINDNLVFLEKQVFIVVSVVNLYWKQTTYNLIRCLMRKIVHDNTDTSTEVIRKWNKLINGEKGVGSFRKLILPRYCCTTIAINRKACAGLILWCISTDWLMNFGVKNAEWSGWKLHSISWILWQIHRFRVFRLH